MENKNLILYLETKFLFEHARPFFITHNRCPISERSLVRSGAAPCFPKAWTEITMIKITHSLLVRFTKLVYCKQQSLMKILVIRIAKHSSHALPCPLPMTITSITSLIQSKELTTPFTTHILFLGTFCQFLLIQISVFQL